VHTGHRIANRNHGVRLARCLQRPESGKRDFAAETSLAITVKGARCSSMNAGPSCSVCVLSELAVAENGAPFTTFPGCNPSSPATPCARQMARQGLDRRVHPAHPHGQRQAEAGRPALSPFLTKTLTPRPEGNCFKRLRFIVIFSSSLPTS